MTLLDHLLARIAANGPLTVADYMAECLLHPTLGYYTTRDPLGAAGDFTTSPEISQMFGELLGLCLAQTWLDQGAPARIALAELGPGRGTLMADILRATRSVPGFATAAEIHLVEASAPLRMKQREALSGHNIIHHDTVDTLPNQSLYCVANEFFDALPIRQFERAGANWAERRIGSKDAALHFGLTEPTPQPALDHRLDDTKDGDLVEICTMATPIIQTIGARIKTYGGAALIVDYGDWRSLGDTVQAMQNHRPVDPLATPGMADITAHVDFETLALAAPCAYSRLTTQGVLLERLGITARANTLAARLEGDALESHVAAHRRLTHPDEMGTLFKAMALYPSGQTPPPGFEP